MNLEAGLFSKLTGTAGISALVGRRVYPLVLPQDALLPAIVYQRISGPRDHTHSGASGLAQARMQFTCIGESYSQAKQVSEAIRAGLDGYKGLAGTVTVGAALMENETDDWGERFDLPVVRNDYMIWYQE